jgi:Arc/MetJ-type ribon-helix-helix transcriptional regulator
VPTTRDNEKLVAVRLSAEEIEALEKMVRIGVAPTVSEAIRVAIRLVPVGLATKVLEDIDGLKNRMNEISKQLADLDLTGEVPTHIGRLPKERLIALAAAADPMLKKAGTEELLRRGFFPDGLGNWVEDRPDTTLPGRTSGRVGSPRGPR